MVCKEDQMNEITTFYLIMAIFALAMALVALPSLVHGPQGPAARSRR